MFASWDKKVLSFWERCFFNFKGKKMTHIISLNTTLKFLENQNASQKQHKRSAKKDFWRNKLEMYRLTSQITWCHHLTSPRLQRATWALFIQMERAKAPKGMDYEGKIISRGLWCLNEACAAQTPLFTSQPPPHKYTFTHTWVHGPRHKHANLCTHKHACMHTNADHASRIDSKQISKAEEDFQNSSVLLRFITALIFLDIAFK